MNMLETEKSVLSTHFNQLPDPNKYPYGEYLVAIPPEPVLTKCAELVPPMVKIETLRFVKMRFIEIGFIWTIKSIIFNHTYAYVFGNLEII